MHTLLRATERIPNKVRAATITVLPFLAYWAATQKATVPSAVFVLWTVVTLVVHLPVMFFDGPLPVSELGVHRSGEIHPWDDVAAIETTGEKDLEAVLTDGRRIPIRAKGSRSREDLWEAIATYSPRHRT